jgi:hypothetical protein
MQRKNLFVFALSFFLFVPSIFAQVDEPWIRDYERNDLNSIKAEWQSNDKDYTVRGTTEADPVDKKNIAIDRSNAKVQADQVDTPCVCTAPFDIDQAGRETLDGGSVSFEDSEPVSRDNGRFYYGDVPLEPEIIIDTIGPTVTPRGGRVEFKTKIMNLRDRDNLVEGDYWVTVILPNNREVEIPDGGLTYSEPIINESFPSGSLEFSNSLRISPHVELGAYRLIGRIGLYPDLVVSEDSFKFYVTE